MQTGIKAGLKIQEIYELELWEFNLYVETYNNELVREKEATIIKQSYYTAYFTNGQKIRPLDYYLKQLRRANGKDTKKVTKSIDEVNKGIEFAKMMSKKITEEERKRGQ